MAVTVTHTFQSTIPDDPIAEAAGEITPTRWNDEHQVTGLGTMAEANTADYLTAVQVAASYQPLDADLTALAALSGTNTLYYRSGAATWSPVTIGTNLTFSSGTLAASSVANSSRYKLTADITVDIDYDTGDDALGDIIGGVAFKTMTGFWKQLCRDYDTGGRKVTAQLLGTPPFPGLSTYGNLDGADAGYGQAYTPVGGGVVEFLGDNTTPANVTVLGSSDSDYCTFEFAHTFDTVVWIKGITHDADNGNIGSTVFVNAVCTVVVDNCRFVNMDSSFGPTVAIGTLINTNGMHIQGAPVNFFQAYQGGTLTIANAGVTVSGLSVSGAFIDVKDASALVYGWTSGLTGTGTRYNVTANGVIDTFGAGSTLFPGNAAGTTATGGQYI